MSSAPQNNSFVVSFKHLKLRKDQRKDYIKAGKIKGMIELQDYVFS